MQSFLELSQKLSISATGQLSLWRDLWQTCHGLRHLLLGNLHARRKTLDGAAKQPTVWKRNGKHKHSNQQNTKLHSTKVRFEALLQFLPG